MRARPLYLATLLLALAGLAAYLVVPPKVDRAERASLERARAVATAFRAPAGGRPRVDCNSDVLRRCWSVDRKPDAVAAELAAALETASGVEPEKVCTDYTHPRGLPMRSCVLRVLTGHGHAATASATTNVVKVGDAFVAQGSSVDVAGG